MRNDEVASFFENIALLLELKDDNPFKIRAYRRAALNIRSLPDEIENIALDEKIEEIPGIGKDLAIKIKEILKTGGLKYYERLRKEVPLPLVNMLQIPGIGPKTAKLIYDKFKIKNINELERLAKAHKLSRLPGLKEKTEENIIDAIELVKKRSERMLLNEALERSREVFRALGNTKGIDKIIAAGSLRRMKDTVRDIDILITSKDSPRVMDVFVNLPMARKTLAHGDTKSSILTKDGVQIDLRAVKPSSFGAALIYFTGSKAHNVKLRGMAKKNGLKVNEYGVFNEKAARIIAGKTEGDVYKALGLDLIPPELREDRGEVEAALEKRLPKLVELSDIKGDFHVHSDYSDGASSIEELAFNCKKRGYEYVAITDHSKRLKVAGGLSLKDVLRKADEIRKLNNKIKGFRILCGVEVDILKDGSLDYSDDVLKDFDIVIAAVHGGFKEPEEVFTSRILRAMDNKYVNIIAHPTCRHLGARDPSKLDFDKVFKAASLTKTSLEINAHPERMDLDDINSRRAVEALVRIAIGTDSHVLEHLDYMELGVSVARRGWLTKKDVLNTMSLNELLSFLRK